MEFTWFLAGVGSGIVIMAVWHMIKHRIRHADSRNASRGDSADDEETRSSR